MSSHQPRPYSYGAVNRQMRRVTADHQRHLRQAWIDRVLDLLDSDNLISQASNAIDADEGLLIECNIAPMVWDDPRITFRLKQLESNDVKVELVEHEHQIAGKTFKRNQIRVSF